MLRKLKVFIFLLVILFSFFIVQNVQALTLGISGNKFTVDGSTKFLTFVSYFDAIRAPNGTLDSDLAYLKSKGIDGIRIFPNWWGSGSSSNPPLDTLMDSNGNLQPNQLANLKNVVAVADGKGLAVDISFANIVPGLSLSNYKKAIIATVTALSGNGNIFYDIHNEYNCAGLSASDIKDIRDAIKTQSSSAMVSASIACGASPSEAVSIANSANLNIINYHDNRTADWYSQTSARVKSIMPASKPIYFGEPEKWTSGSGLTADNFVTAVTQAKSAGAAAWTFHTKSAYNLGVGSMQNSLDVGVEKKFLDTFSAKLSAVTWGGGGGTAPPPVIPPPGGGNNTTCIDSAPPKSTVPDMISVVRSVASSIDINTTCVKGGGSWAFMDELVRRLRAGPEGTRWAYNAKRSNLDDPWADGPAYYYGPGLAPRPGTTDIYEVFAIDAITSMCPVAGVDPPSSPGWIVNDWPGNPATCGSNDSCVAYLYPRTAGGNSSKPAETFCSNVVLPPPGGGSEPAPGVPPGPGNPPDPIPPPVQPFPPSVTLPVPSQGLPTDLGQLISAIFVWSLSLIGLVIFVRFFYAGFLWFTAAGSSDRTSRAKTIMKNAVYGTLVLFSAWLILNTINPDLVKSTFTLPGLPAEQTTTGTTPTTSEVSGQPIPTASLLSDLQAERAKYGTTVTHEEAGKILNAVAWKNSATGWGLLSKSGGNNCPLNGIGQPVSCDWLVHKPSLLGLDVFGDAPGIDASGSRVNGKAIPGWGDGYPVEQSKWVAPVAP